MSVQQQAGAARDLGVTTAYVARFRRRATRLFAMSAVILLAIFALLGFGAYVFVSASGIAATDISRSDPVDERTADLRRKNLKSETEFLRKISKDYEAQFEVGRVSALQLAKARRELNAAAGRLKLIEHKLLTHSRTGVMPELDAIESRQELEIARETLLADQELLATLRKQVDAALKGGAGSSVDLTLVDRELIASRADLDYVNALLEQARTAPEGEGQAESGENSMLALETRQIIQTNITRFGTLLLIFFFIRIMLPIYRYYVRLGTIYNGQADALVLVRQTKQKDLGKLVASLTPVLAFEKAPSTPLDNTLQLIKEIAPILARR